MITSKHLLKSNGHNIEISPLSVAARMLSVTDSNAVSVGCWDGSRAEE